MSYVKKTWASGDTVTSSALNNMETGIENAANPFIVTLTPTDVDYSGVMDKTWEEINSAFEAGRKIVFVVNAGSYTARATADEVVWTSGDDYPSIGARIIDANNNIIIFAYIPYWSAGESTNTYDTAIYPLTPMN